MKKKNKWITAIALISIGMFIAGYLAGSALTLRWCVHFGYSFIKAKGIDLDIDEEFIYHGIKQYKQQIDGCYLKGGE